MKMHLKMTVHKMLALKSCTESEAANEKVEVAVRDIVPLVDIATFMKQPFTETDNLHEE